MNSVVTETDEETPITDPYDVTNFTCLKTLDIHMSSAYSPDGTKIISGSWDKPLRYGMQTQDNALKPWPGTFKQGLFRSI